MNQQAIVRLHSPREWEAERLADVVSAVFSPDHEMWSTDSGAVAITDGTSNTPPIWFVDVVFIGAPYCAAEIVGPRAETIAFAKACARAFSASASDVSIDLDLVDDAGWANRTPREQISRGEYYEDATPLVPRVIDMPVEVIEFSPWISALIASAQAEPHSLIIRTPESTRISPYMRRIFDTFQVLWIRETADGPVEGITGLGYNWTSDGVLELAEGRKVPYFTPDGLRIRLQVLHPLDDTEAVGEASERLLAATVGLPHVRVGRTEISRVPWDRELVVGTSAEVSPELITWCLSGPGTRGTLDLIPATQGVLEDIFLELPAGESKLSSADARALWDQFKEYMPLGFVIAEGMEATTRLVHESAEHALKDDLDPWEGGFGYLGYLGGNPGGKNAGEGPDGSLASDEAAPE
ncbi:MULTISPECIES: DUF6177 family protein [Dermabacter]|uniref:DUF6177 family protein n=1 Tax=Dermabacter TaxID=36739 RepID=UPI000354990F|nr:MULTISPECIES: DUF6177 family protein [Dermabacter]EPH15091.1 hypothetical protein HMPREF1484_00716 [Dermabacter sp. HFH0086]MCT1956062.1 DUF6177 family protein [Dermabacter hominis]MDU4693605.1 DUF6177 family protein [Dermabacter sp.]